MGFFSNKKFDDFELYPDEVFLDSGNLPHFDTQQLEGVIEKPIRTNVFYSIGAIFGVVFLIFLGRLLYLQGFVQEEYALLAKDNSLQHEVLFTERGVIYDREGEELAWNAPLRTYSDRAGLAHILGYVGYPTEGEIGGLSYHPQQFVGRDGVEISENETLSGTNGLKVVEVDVAGEVRSESVLQPPEDGANVHLSIDARVQEALHKIIRDLAHERGFVGGSGVVLDVERGEVLALTNYPEYDPRALSYGSDPDAIEVYRNDSRKPFLNRAISGVYTPGSIFKPFVAAAALAENVIDKDKIVVTNGYLSIPNPYDPESETIFRDWKNHGAVAMEDALAVSSNVYFFTIGGGYESQKGLGIEKIARYARGFGFGKETNISLQQEQHGLIPTPEWKEEVEGDVWRIGDTYNTSIGQYSLTTTPIQVARGIAAIANGGRLVTPTLVREREGKKESVPVSDDVLSVVRSGMRQAVTEGTATGLSLPYVTIAAKTGTAEIDFGKQFVNSWVTGFFPYEAPRYAFAIVMERGPRENFIGGVFAARQLLEWMHIHTPEYLAAPQ